MIFGLLAGEWLRSERTRGAKIKGLIIVGVAGIVLGKVIEVAGLCPIVKRIWTPSWAIYSAGIVTLLLAFFVAVIDSYPSRKRHWTFPLMVAGLNPIALYCLWQLSGSWIQGTFRTHLGHDIFTSFGSIYAPIVERSATLLVLWLILWWMYRRKIFLRV